MVHVPLMFLSEWREFSSAHCLAEKKLMPARVSMLLKSRSSPDMLPFSLCNKKSLAVRHMNRPLFPTTLSIPSYDIGKYVGLRTYQQPLVLLLLVLVVLCECFEDGNKLWGLKKMLVISLLAKKFFASQKGLYST